MTRFTVAPKSLLFTIMTVVFVAQMPLSGYTKELNTRSDIELAARKPAAVHSQLRLGPYIAEPPSSRGTDGHRNESTFRPPRGR